MIKATPIILGIGAYALITLSAKKSGASTLNFYISNAGVSMDGLTPVINITLAIQNPSNADYTLKSLTANLTANGNTIGNVSSFQQVYIARNNVTPVTLSIRLSLFGIGIDIYNAISNGTGIQQDIELKGTANVDTILIPIDLTYKIGSL